MKLAPGVRLGPYEVVAPIGAGGMGEVYRALDTRLGRAVAIKIFPAEFVSDAKLRIRFEREAKTISALSHPHICALYDVGPDYLVMEHCEGKTLAKRLSAGPLPLEQVLDYGIQIADALDKAHRKGIIHRDLKPSNIMLTKSGVKLLDFGLAKQHTDSPIAESAVQQVTEEGKILGTIQYMAPELFNGKEADARSDIFAFGLVLYEMATGKPAFSAASKASLIAAILEHEPPQISSPHALDRLIRACLAKDRDERIQTAHDVALQLKWIADGVSVVPSTAVRRTVVAWTVAAVALIFGLGALALWKFRPVGRATPGVRRFSILIPTSTPLWSTVDAMISVSPDGSRIVYSARKEGVVRLYQYSMATATSKEIPGTEGGSGPFFSPDGQWVGFSTADGELKKVSVAGGSPFTISTSRTVRGATWGPDNTIVFGEKGAPLQRLSAAGGAPHVLGTPNPEISVRWPAFLPGGKQILYTIGDHNADFENAKLAVLDLDSGKSKIVLEEATCGRYVRTGHLVYAHSRNLFAVVFDTKTMQVVGSPTPIVDDLAGPLASGVALFTVSDDGSLFYVPDSTSHEGELVWADRRGKISSLAATRRIYEEAPRLSPDGKQLIVVVGAFPRYDLWRYEIERDSWTRMTSEATNIDPVWSPDSKQIVFTSNRSGVPNLFLMPSDGARPPKQITWGTTGRVAYSWSPDGQTIAIGEENSTGKSDISLLSVGSWTSKRFSSGRFNEGEAVFSPDGHWLAFESNESGQREIYVQSDRAGGRKWRISSDRGLTPRWRADGRELFYFKGKKVMAVDIRFEPEFSSGRPRVLFEAGPGVFPADEVAPDGQRFVMFRFEDAHQPDRINVVLGLFETLERSRAPRTKESHTD